LDDPSRSLDEQPAWSVSVTNDELYLLAGLLGVPHLLGVQDPQIHLLPVRPEGVLERARLTLVERGLLRVEADGSATPDARLADAARANGYARITLLASRTDTTGAAQLRQIHCRPELLVEQEPLPDGRIGFTALPDLAALHRRLLTFLALPETPAAPGPELTLPENALTEARRLLRAGDEQACRDLLRAARVAPETAELLSGTLAPGHRAGSLVTLLRTGQVIRYGESLAWLAGQDGAWRVQVVEQPGPAMIRLIPTDTATIQRRLGSIARGISL
jgi:hypothetical protein